MVRESTVYENLYTELISYEKNGVYILLDGNHASPMQVVREVMCREAGSYMRDYDMDPQGNTTSGLGIDKNNVDHTVYELLLN